MNTDHQSFSLTSATATVDDVSATSPSTMIVTYAERIEFGSLQRRRPKRLADDLRAVITCRSANNRTEYSGYVLLHDLIADSEVSDNIKELHSLANSKSNIRTLKNAMAEATSVTDSARKVHTWVNTPQVLAAQKLAAVLRVLHSETTSNDPLPMRMSCSAVAYDNVEEAPHGSDEAESIDWTAKLVRQLDLEQGRDLKVKVTQAEWKPGPLRQDVVWINPDGSVFPAARANQSLDNVPRGRSTEQDAGTVEVIQSVFDTQRPRSPRCDTSRNPSGRRGPGFQDTGQLPSAPPTSHSTLHSVGYTQSSSIDNEPTRPVLPSAWPPPVNTLLQHVSHPDAPGRQNNRLQGGDFFSKALSFGAKNNPHAVPSDICRRAQDGDVEPEPDQLLTHASSSSIAPSQQIDPAEEWSGSASSLSPTTGAPKSYVTMSELCLGNDGSSHSSA